jgi:hypothetical protein
MSSSAFNTSFEALRVEGFGWVHAWGKKGILCRDVQPKIMAAVQRSTPEEVTCPYCLEKMQ